jgi:hypothetical protein
MSHAFGVFMAHAGTLRPSCADAGRLGVERPHDITSVPAPGRFLSPSFHGWHYDPSIQPSTRQTSRSGGDSTGCSMAPSSPDLSAALNHDVIAQASF